jgi:hypothetical protein
MAIKLKSIVRRIGTNEIYEVIGIYGDMISCKSINNRYDGVHPILNDNIPFATEELELMMEEETDVFNILFREDDET